MATLDFSKAFDKVPHRCLLNNLQLYSINRPTHNWIIAFLMGRSQSVVVEGSKSISSPVTSGVPQGSVLGSLLVLLFINDLPSVLDPTTRCKLFAEDCLVYGDTKTIQDQIQLQRDLHALENWGTQWGMSFNMDKCNIMTQDYAQSCEHSAKWPRPSTRQPMHQKLPQQETATPQTLYQGIAQLPTYVVEADSIEASKNQLVVQTTP